MGFWQPGMALNTGEWPHSSTLWPRQGLQAERLQVGVGLVSCGLAPLTHLPSQDMENKIRSTLNEIYFGKTKDIVNGLR